MVSVHDVAAFILREFGAMTTYKLQKLVYYAQGWSLGLSGKALFAEPLQAWSDGPASPALFGTHRGQREVGHLSKGEASAITADQAEFLRHVLAPHVARSPERLVDDTHSETPWLAARAGVRDGVSSQREITHEALTEFFGNPVVQGILRTTGEDEAVIEELADRDRAGLYER